MTTKSEIITKLEESIKILTQAVIEREELLRAFLRNNNVKKAGDLDDLEAYRAGADLEEQIEDLKDVLDDVKYGAVKLGAFKSL